MSHTRRSMALLAAILCGCGGSSFPETYEVTGLVNYQGEPVAGANVNLVPINPEVRSASGVTDPQGVFTVKTYFSPEHNPTGAMSGDYLITVSKMETPVPPADMDQWEVQEWAKKAGAPKSLLPKKYQIPDRSGLRVTVRDEAPDPIKLDLVD